MADDARQAQAFAEASRQLTRVTEELRDFNQSAGKEIALTVAGDLKKVTDSFTQPFLNLPGVQTLGAVGKTLFNKGFAMLKDKREQALLRQRLGLTREQFGHLKKQQAVFQAQEKEASELKSATQNLLGFDVDQFNIAAGMFTNDKGGFMMGVDKLIGMQSEQLDADEKARSNEMKGAAKRVEKDNEKMRQEQETQSIFHSIARGIDNLAEGVANIKAEDVGMGLLAPIGLIGAVIVSFVGAFVAEVKKQFAGIKAIILTFDKLFDPIKAIIRNTAKTFAGPDTLIGKFFTFIGDKFKSIKSFFTTGLTNLQGNKFITTASTMLDDFIKGVKSLFQPVTRVFGAIGNSVTSVSAMAAEGGVIGKILGFAKGFGAVLGKLFLPVTIVMSAFDLITGFIDGWKESDGDSIVSKFIDGVGGGLSKLIGNLIGMPLDLLKDGVSWIMGKLGFDSAVEFLDSFSFKDLLMDIVSAPFNLVSKAVDYIVGLFTGENDLIADLMSGMKNIGEAAKDLLKGILRGILPNPAGEEGGSRIANWIRGAVSSVIPDGVYEFAGLDPETGARILPEPDDTQSALLKSAGLTQDFAEARASGDADRMEELIRASEEMKGQQGGVIVNNYNNTDNSTNSSSSNVTTQPLKDTAAPAGTVPVL
tara:strand:- start:57 stop:2000 length:1944 start_codon:yes stop_codon:yes gene_type:complete